MCIRDSLLCHGHTICKIIFQELCESRGGRPGLSVLTSLLVSLGKLRIIEPCFGIGHNLSLICQLTSDIASSSLSFPESRRNQEEGGELDSHEEASPEEIMSREVVLGWRVGLLLLQLFPNGGATDIVFVTVLNNS